MAGRFVASEEAGWTPALVAILVYLFVVHSYRLPLGTAAIGVGLVALLLEARALRIPPFLWWFGGYLLWALGTMSLGIAPERSWERWQDFGKMWLIAFLVANAPRSEKQWRIVLVGWLAMFALFPFRGTVMNYLQGITHAGRYGWNFAFQNPNDLAAITLLVLSLSVAFMRTPRTAWVRWCARVGALTLPLLILLTGSRGGLLALGVFAAVLLAFSRKRMGTVVLVGMAGLVALPLLPNSIKSRFTGMKFLSSTETLRQADSSAEQRFVILQVAAAVARDNPLFGVGIGNYPLANGEYAQRRPEWSFARGNRDSHNTYLTLAAENGLIGLGLMAAGALGLLRFLLRASREGRRLAPSCPDPSLREALLNRPPAFIAGTVAFLVAGMFGSLFYIIFPFLFVVCAYGVTDTLLRQARALVAPGTLGRGPAPLTIPVSRVRRFVGSRPRVA